MRIAFVNQKGGVGKSTVAALLTAALKAAGLEVAVCDKDPQGSLSYWATNVGHVPLYNPDAPPPAFTIVDSPGHLDLTSPTSKLLFSEVVSTADRIVIVSEMSLFSVRAAVLTAEAVKASMPKGAKAYILFNQVRRGTLVGQQDMAELAKNIGLPHLQNWLPLASAYEQFISFGWSAVTGQERERVVAAAKEIIS